MFGKNARLDVQGGFHASTADYLRLRDGGRFDARQPNNSILTVAPVEAFGFLTNSPAPLSVESSLLFVPPEKTLSLIGGDIAINQAELSAQFGRINLASVAGIAEVIPKYDDFVVPALRGDITVQNSQISTSGEGGGNVFIRAGQFMADNSTIYSRTLGTQDGGVIDIQADQIRLTNRSKIQGGTENTGDGTDIQLYALDSIYINNGSLLSSSAGDIPNLNQNVGDAGHISLQAKDIKIENVHYRHGIFSSDTHGTGQGGDIHFRAENSLHIVNGSFIQASTWGNDELAGKGGNFYLSADTLKIEGSIVGTGSSGSADAGQLVIQTGQLYMGKMGDNGMTSWLQTNNWEQGNSGKITIQADNIWLEDGAGIDSRNRGNGNAGDIDIQAHNQIIIRGTDEDGFVTMLYSASVPNEGYTQGGNAGNIHIRAKEMRLEAGGRIDAASKTGELNSSSGQAGNIVLDIQEGLILSGVNPYGENYHGFGSVISARSQGNYSGNAGNIEIQAGSVSILDGALVETGSDNQSRGGNIQIHASDYITISGDASKAILNEPANSQQAYLSTNPQNYNQSISGIYAHSTSVEVNSGDSGHIELSTPRLTVSNQGQISTASFGGGKAGQIILNVEKLVVSDNALIRSNSDLVNQLTFDSVAVRDNYLIGRGTVVKTQYIGDGKAIYHINLGNLLVNFRLINQVADMIALKQLSEPEYGDIVIVAKADHGQSARFIYVPSDGQSEPWTRVNEDSQTILEHPVLSLGIFNFVDDSKPFYQNGTLIHVKDMGNGKAADFIYTVRTVEDNERLIYGIAFRVMYYQIADIAALENLVATTDLLVGTQIDVNRTKDGNPTHLVFDGTGWVRQGQMISVPDLKARQNLVLAKAGHIAHLPTGDTIYTGKEWINLGQTYRVNSLSERDALNVQQGDLVKVANTGNGRHDAFLYANGQWIKQIRGGDAGQIVINADTIQLSDGSEISTGSISGGGGTVTLNVDKLVYLNNSQVSTSVQEGVGNGGDLTVTEPQFVVLNNGKIIAQANEGNGGNIYIQSEQFVTSPKSLVSASSKLGIDGDVEIDAPIEDLDAMLVVLPGGHLEAQLPEGCNIDDISELSTFYIYPGQKGKMRTPEDFIE
jgi:large exoprotein involved in heme utilization and adhesion